jgi:hypothetical protein
LRQFDVASRCLTAIGPSAALAHAANGDVSFSEWRYDVEMEGAAAFGIVKVAVRRWKDGRIVRERFYNR